MPLLKKAAAAKRSHLALQVLLELLEELAHLRLRLEIVEVVVHPEQNHPRHLKTHTENTSSRFRDARAFCFTLTKEFLSLFSDHSSTRDDKAVHHAKLCGE